MNSVHKQTFSPMLARGLAAAAVACVFLGSLSAPASAQKLYRWVDENGQVHVGDRIPPKYAQQRREELNDRGVIVGVQAKRKTEADLKAERLRAAVEAQAQREAEARVRYDHYLITTFENESALTAARDAHLATVDGRLELARRNVDDTEATLARLSGRRADLQAQDKEVPEKLTEQIATFEQGLVDALRAVRSIQAERRESVERFERDIARFRVLMAAMSG